MGTWFFFPLYHNQADGYRSTGCIDLKCDGFVPVNYAPITPGDSLEGQSKISIKIFKVQIRSECLLCQQDTKSHHENTTPSVFKHILKMEGVFI